MRRSGVLKLSSLDNPKMKQVIGSGHLYGDITLQHTGEDEWRIEQSGNYIFLGAIGLSKLADALNKEERKSEDDWTEEQYERIHS